MKCRFHTATLIDGVIWYIGGCQKGPVDSAVYTYNVATATWERMSIR